MVLMECEAVRGMGEVESVTLLLIGGVVAFRSPLRSLSAGRRAMSVIEFRAWGEVEDEWGKVRSGV